MEASVSDFVLSIILPVIYDVGCRTGHKVKLFREKQVVSDDSVTGGYEELAAIDGFSTPGKKYVFIVEAKESSSVRRWGSVYCR